MDISCFQQVLRIIQARESSRLIDAMQSVIAEVLPQVETGFYEALTTSTIEFRRYGARFSEAVSDERLLMQAYSLQHPVQNKLEDGRTKYVHPIAGVGGIKLLVEVVTDNEQNYPVQEQLMLLFKNQFILLDKNNHDALTSLYNRQAFEEMMLGLIINEQRRDEPAQEQNCFALLDIDHFKQVNDTYGHLYGDEVLILFAGIMGRTFRNNDLLFRYGGEEFAVVLRNINLATASKVLERFRSNVELFEFPQVGKITVSIGLTAVTGCPTVVSLVQNADNALYYSKEHGRNQINSYESLLAAGKIKPGVTSERTDIELF